MQLLIILNMQSWISEGVLLLSMPPHQHFLWTHPSSQIKCIREVLMELEFPNSILNEKIYNIFMIAFVNAFIHFPIVHIPE